MFVLQNICYPFYKLNGLCNYVFYFCLPSRFFSLEPSLSLCLCPIWEYQGLFLDTYNARHNCLSIDYAWSGSLIQIRLSKLPLKWKEYLENHERFVSYKRVQLLYKIVTEDAFSIAIKNIERNPKVPGSVIKEIKQGWCNCPSGFESAINWKAYDSDYFTTCFFWPDKDNDLWEPNNGFH